MDFFAQRRAPRPERIPTDTVLPLPIWDDQQFRRAICLHVTFRFDEVLDTTALDLALCRLLNIGGWHRLGARLRMNDNGRLEYHVPVRYSAHRPGIHYTVAKHSLGINEHPLSHKLPRSTGQPTLLDCEKDVMSLCLAPDCPQQLEDWIYSDRPQLDIHAVTFSDATLLSVTFLHSLMDGIGLASFLKAWTYVLKGQEEQVPIFQGVGDDPLGQLTERTPAHKYVNSNLMLRGCGLLIFIIRYIFEAIWYWNNRTHIICVPGHLVDELRIQGLHEMADPKNDEHSNFLTEDDVLLAWWTKAMIRALNPSRNRMVSLVSMFNIRSMLVNGPLSENTAFITNTILTSFTFLRCHDILQQPLSVIASRARSALSQQRTEPQIEALLATQKVNLLKTKRPPLYGDSSCLMICCTNCHRCRFFDLDFSSAVVSSSSALSDRQKLSGRPTSVIPTYHLKGFRLPNVGGIIGKDASGTWWLMWTLRKGAWPAIEHELNNLAKKTGSNNRQ
ncbi:hypothetical protein BJX65DRAFT_318068 [Aspergillus insuetus]